MHIREAPAEEKALRILPQAAPGDRYMRYKRYTLVLPSFFSSRRCQILMLAAMHSAPRSDISLRLRADGKRLNFDPTIRFAQTGEECAFWEWVTLRRFACWIIVWKLACDLVYLPLFPAACCHLAAIAKENKRHKANRVSGVAKGHALPISSKASLERFKPPPPPPLFIVFIFVLTHRRRTHSHSPRPESPYSGCQAPPCPHFKS